MLYNNMFAPLAKDSVWLDKGKYDEAEKDFYKDLASKPVDNVGKSSLADEIATARKKIQNSLKDATTKIETDDSTNNKVRQLEAEHATLKQLVLSLQEKLVEALKRIETLEKAVKPASHKNPSSEPAKTVTFKPAADEDDDDIDLFGSDDDDAASAAKLREERLQAYAEKKSKKTAIVAKSSVVLDVKPWDDETDMKEMELKVREVKSDGLVWGASKLVPLAFGIKKLQIVAVVEDDKVSIDELQETIQEMEDLVQSVDIAAFNKL